ncbi:MAG: hypothetical protein ABW110_22210, partial [Steroidobacteraceae bacterium]
MRILAMLGATVSVWLLRDPYHGLDHDAMLYSLQALARISPDLYAHDLFLRYGSQEKYTLFTPFFAYWISLLGLPVAAAALTCAFQAFFFAGLLVLAARVMDRRLAWLAAGIALSVPGYYGAYEIFEIVEPFLTPRLPAEGLLVLGLAAHVSGARILGYAISFAALCVHPLMSFPVLCLMGWSDRPEGTTTFILVLGVLSVGAVTALAFFHPIGSICIMDGEWLRIVRTRNLYLFLDSWRVEDWQRIVAFMSLPLMALQLHGSPSTRRLLEACVAVGLCGLALAAYTSFGPKIPLLLQGQPWRWLWPTTLMSLLLAPWLIFALWREGDIGRTCSCLVVGTLAHIENAGFLGLVACVLWIARERIEPRHGRSLRMGGFAVAAVVAISAFADIYSALTIRFLTGQWPAVISITRNIVSFVVPAVLLL